MKRILNSFRSIIRSIFFSIISADTLKRTLDARNIQKCLNQVTIGEGSRFYPEAIVENMTGYPDKIIIGRGSHIRGELELYPGATSIIIGDNSYIGKWSVVRAGEQVTIGCHVLIAHHVSIIDSNSHEYDALERAEAFMEMISNGHSKRMNIETGRIVIEDYAWISYNVSILKKVTVGRGAIIGAGSVVTHDVPPWTIVAGNPARIIRTVNKPEGL